MELRTILFVDQVGSTRKLADLGDEAMVPIRQRLWSIVRGAVEGRGGRIFSDEGDGGAAVFDDAESAHDASLAIVSEAAAASLELRVGLHSGSVVANGDGFVGLAVHTAARLCDAAPTGFVLTTAGEADQGTDATRRLTAFGQRAFKGFPQPVDVMLLTDPNRSAPPVEELLAVAAPVQMVSSPLLLESTSAFVGRDDVFDRLVGVGRASRDDIARIVLVAGEPGAGKSTLVHRAARSLIDDGALCLVGRSDDAFDDPFHEIIELLAHLVREAPVALLAEHVLRHGDLLTRWLPGLGDRIPSAARVDDDAARTPDRRRLYEAVAGLLRSVSRARPLVLILEDLHWATRPTLDLVRHLLDDHDLQSVLVLVTYRSTEVDDGSAFAELLARLIRNERAETIRIEPLDLAAVTVLVETAQPDLSAQRPDLIAPLAGHLVEATNGNALFCAEFLRHIDVGALAEIDLESVASWMAVPASVQDLACERVDRFGPDVAGVLALASVLGDRFGFRELQRMVELDAGGAPDVLAALDRGERIEVIRPVDDVGREFAFGHALVRDALYARLTTAERMRRHRDAADALGVGLAGAGRPAEVLSHLTAAGPLADPDDVWRTASRAAADAMERLAPHEAIDYHLRAVDALDAATSPTARERAMTVFALGRTQTAVGMAVGGMTMVDAAAIARTAKDWDLLAQIAVAYGGDLKENQATIDVSAPVSLIQEAITHHPDATAMRARLLISLALWQRQTMTLDDRRSLVDEAMKIAESLADPVTLADVLSQRHRALHGPDVALEGLDDADRLDELAQQLGDDLIAFQAMNIRMMTTFQLGDWNRARSHAASRAEIGERLRNFEGRRLATMWQLLEAQVRGEAEVADRINADLMDLIGLYPVDVRSRFFAAAGVARMWLAGHAGPMYESVPKMVNSDITLAWMASDSGRITECRQHLDRSGGVTRMQAQSDYMWSHDVVALTRASRAVDDLDVAGELYEVVLPYRSFNATMGALTFLGAIEHHLGSMAVTLGWLDAAVAHFEAAVERHDDMEAVPYLALSRAELSTTLRSRNGAGDVNRADELAELATQRAEELGLGLVKLELER